MVYNLIVTNKSPNIIKLVYKDAFYSYKKQAKPPQGEIISYGNIVSETDAYVDMEIAWGENPHKTFFGIVVPKNHLKNKDMYDTCVKNDVIAVYWNDVFTYDAEYSGRHIPTPMLTEGAFLGKVDEYLLVSDPETLNLTKTENHPEKKPVTYCIPVSIITALELVKKCTKN